MRIDSVGTFPLVRHGFVGVRHDRPPLVSEAGAPQETRRGLAALLSGTIALRTLVQRLDRALAPAAAAVGTRRLDFASAASRAALGLETEATFTTLASTEEINTIPTSFGPRAPSFTTTSTSQPTIGGTYTGGTDDVLTFTVDRPGDIDGNQSLRILMRDGVGTLLQTIDIPKNTPANTSFALANGLTLAFGPGRIDKNDTFSVTVSASVGSAVAPDNPFNGSGSADPSFEPGLGVTAGSFTVNGVAIAVGAGDTLHAVAARITASAADVTATFDAATERIRLQRKTAGSGSIVLASDTSGFLAATKLASAVPVLGRDADADRPLAAVPALAGIAAGTFHVNGVISSVDPAVDSLRALLARITASAAGVDASFVDGGNGVRLAARERGTPIVLDDGTSGLFAALDIARGSHGAARGIPDARVRTLLRAHVAVEGIAGLGEALADLFARATAAPASGGSDLRAALGAAIATAFDDGRGSTAAGATTFSTGFGLDFTLGGPSPQVRFDAAAYRSAVGRDPAAIVDFLLRDRSGADGRGLLASLESVLARSESLLRQELGARGVLVSVSA